MSCTKRLVNGVRVWVIDLRFRTVNGPERYRRAAKDQRSQKYAEAEERSIHEYFRVHGTIKPLLGNEPQAAPKPRRDSFTWDQALVHYQAHEYQTLSTSTQRSFKGVWSNPVFEKAWKGRKLQDITYQALVVYFGQLGKTRKPATLHQHRSVLLQVLKSVGPQGDAPGEMLDALPRFPKKVRIGKQAYELPTDAQVEAIFAEVATPGSYLRPKALRRIQLAYALASHAGLRASEVRALLAEDIDLTKKTLTVRRSEHYGVAEGTKSGDERVIPIAHPRLLKLLTKRLAEMAGKEERHVALQSSDQPWGQHGLKLAYTRTTRRLGLPLSKFHGLRHYYCTSLIRRGVPLSTVQYLMGHSSLVVTNRYAHALEAEGRQAEVERAFADVSDSE